MDEDKRDERLAGLMTGMLADETVGSTLRLGPEFQVRRRLPLAIAVAAAVTLVVGLAVGAALYWRSLSPPDSTHAGKPVVQSVPGAVPSPKAFVAIAPPRPVLHRVYHHYATRQPVERARAAPVTRSPLPPDDDFAPPEQAYGPYPATPLNADALRRVLVEDRRRTRELNRRELRALEGP